MGSQLWLLLWAAAAACAAARPCAPAPGAVTINGRKVKACGRSACGGGPASRCGCNATEAYGGAASVTLALQHAKPLPLAKFGGCYPLAPADFARSVAHLGARRLRRFLAKCARGDAVHVLVVGGSVAVGYAADGPPSSAALVHWLEKTFPRAKIERTSLAQSGTDSFFFAAHLERLSHKADLVIVDYLTNDLGILDGDTTAHTMRAVVEKILRAALALPRAPAALLVGILRTVELTTARNFEFQDEVYQPLAEAYDVTLVSYRDAIWPDFATPPPAAVYETRKGSHPTWYIHQLIADAMVYACALVMNDLGDAAEAPPAIPMAPIFRDEAVDALSTCREPLTHLVGDGLRDGVAGAAPARWAWWDLRPTKEGWQYVSADEDFEAALREGTGNGTARRLQRGKRSTNNGAGARAAAKARQGARQRARARPKAAAKPAAAALRPHPDGHALHLVDPLSFRMNFSDTPGLVVTYLRSYEHFGAALVTVGDNADEVLKLVRAQHAYRHTCERLTGHGAKIDDFRYSRKCTQHLSGELADPWVLDGHWSDQSSQAFVMPLVHPWVGLHDNYLVSTKKHAPVGTGPVYATTDLDRPLAPPGEATVTLSFAGWQHGDRTRFKLMELRSC